MKKINKYWNIFAVVPRVTTGKTEACNSYNPSMAQIHFLLVHIMIEWRLLPALITSSKHHQFTHEGEKQLPDLKPRRITATPPSAIFNHVQKQWGKVGVPRGFWGAGRLREGPRVEGSWYSMRQTPWHTRHLHFARCSLFRRRTPSTPQPGRPCPAPRMAFVCPHNLSPQRGATQVVPPPASARLPIRPPPPRLFLSFHAGRLHPLPLHSLAWRCKETPRWQR